MTDDSTRDLLRETATRLFQDLCQPAALRAAEGGIWPAALWSAVEEAGLPRALVPESAGGHGVGFADAAVKIREAQRTRLEGNKDEFKKKRADALQAVKEKYGIDVTDDGLITGLR